MAVAHVVTDTVEVAAPQPIEQAIVGCNQDLDQVNVLPFVEAK